MSKIKEFYFNEFFDMEEIRDMIDDEYFYDLWKKQSEEDEFIERYYEENKERIEAEKIFSLTNTYPF